MRITLLNPPPFPSPTTHLGLTCQFLKQVSKSPPIHLNPSSFGLHQKQQKTITILEVQEVMTNIHLRLCVLCEVLFVCLCMLFVCKLMCMYVFDNYLLYKADQSKLTKIKR